MSDPEIKLNFPEQNIPGPGPSVPLPQITRLIKTVTTEPTGTPRSFFEQFRIYSGALWFYDTVTNLWQSASGAVTSTFLALTDTPDSYSGEANKLVAVKADESGLEFIDAPMPTAGGSDKEIQFNNGGSLDGVEFITYYKSGDGEPTLQFTTDDDTPRIYFVGAGQMDATDFLSLSGETGALLGGGPNSAEGGGAYIGVAKDGDANTDDGFNIYVKTVGPVNPGGATGRFVLTDPTNNPAYAYRMVQAVSVSSASFTPVDSLFIHTKTDTGGLLRLRVSGFHAPSGDTFACEYVQAFKNDSGTVSLLGSLTPVFFYGDNASVDARFAVSGTDVQVQVKSDGSDTYNFQCELFFQEAS